MPPELLNADVTLERFPGKGGWTYAPLPATVKLPGAYFGAGKVSGQIDAYVLENVSLMSMGQGRLFLPVRAEIRHRIGKQAGDTVRLVLHGDQPEKPLALNVSEAELRDCLADVPGALAAFEQLTPAQRRVWVQWVAAATLDDHKVHRVEMACTLLSQGISTPPATYRG
ncbi:YdeI/OmpD-associated family protein [Hymenobacter metallilatus]|uniref:DUF1905 domain-containing protein n=1 Tax=Hymenobacter metallilatus TaxID=2493666 RepID=A0A3R9MTZ5_9BACT|nr:YdeI/OmpD-associated family protein [Hymenobacter metallilatus]RSK30088.1 DUF1905 domain-containing protein [Hymenobacter metallilatus]